MLPPRLQERVDELAPLDKMTRSLLLLDYADALGPFPEEDKTELHRVRGCTATVYVTSAVEDAPDGPRMRYAGWADAEVVKGLVALLVLSLDGEPPEAVLRVDPSFVREAGLTETLTPTRQGGLASVLARMQGAARASLPRASGALSPTPEAAR